jgi:two-component system, OmpR family, heavy metal sensor histidine kinase CusS
MFSSRTEPRSIATQLVLLFTVCAALILAAALGVFYWMVVRHALEEDDGVLADKIDELQTRFEQNGGLQALAVEFQAASNGESAFLVRVIDPGGATVAETSEMSALLPPNAFPPAASREIAIVTQRRGGGRLYGLTARHALGSGENLRDALAKNRFFTIQVAQDRSGDEQAAHEFGLVAISVIVIGSGVAAALAVTVTRRGLRPLAKMRRTFERVQPAHLNERIEPERWPTELKPLAASFDDMLGRLEDSFTRLSQFSADLAHELRTPIANMLGEAQVTLTRDRSAEEYRSVIESTVAECERLSGIVDNLLFLARAEAADRQIQTSHFDGRAAIEKIAAYYQALAEDRHLTITCTGDGEICADPVLFGRAVSNLVDNALRFTSDGGTIRISVAPSNGHFEVRVSDTGCGIAPEHLPSVFDRLYRVDPSRSSQGAGLGLALVKSIVDLHNGSTRIESEVGRGTTVVLTFPNQTRPKSNA